MTTPGTAQPAAAPPARKPGWLRAAIPADEPDGQAATALAVELEATGTFTAREINGIISQATGPARDKPARARAALDSLRIAAHTAPRFPDRDNLWRIDCGVAVAVTHVRGGTPLTTADQLDSVAAVVAFILWKQRDGVDAPVTKSQMLNEEVVPHSALDRLLRQRPGDLDRILDFVLERGILTEDAVHEMREWLDGAESPAVANGWL